MKTTKLLLTLAIAVMSLVVSWGNTITTVGQVTTAVTVSDDVDYVITSATPFSGGGSVNIANTEHAVLIIQSVRPSVVISDWLQNHVYINGNRAIDGSNCQVKMYAHGTIIMPYSSSIKPLTVYSEKNFGGTAVNDFGLENTGGYMNTLTDAKLNNKIRSFKLKRGYMVTFSTRASGRGYSRCFIADKADLEISSLPMVLDQRISSYRVFQWYDAQKKGLASDTREFENSLITSSWCYSWGLGESRLPDAECVPNHIYEDWPSSSECGKVTYACHMKTNNEPGNASDDHPQSVETVLANWENLMRTGFRLCSESSHDGSWSHLRAFIDSIDARGWRCDLLDLHCYWPSGNFNNWKYYYDTYGGRPIWISEWVWGASWNNNGIFATDRTYSLENQQKNADELKKIIPNLNNSPYVERYAYWNSEADCSKIIKDGALSIAGEYYASVESGLGYNSEYEKIPNTPPQYDPSNLFATYDKQTKQVTLEWEDKNGEYNQLMEIQCKKAGTSIWTTVATVEQKEEAATYSETIDGVDGDKFRVRIVDLKGKERLTNEATAVNDNLTFGDDVTVVTSEGTKTMYLGGNILVNGSFDLGTTDWTNAAGEPLSAPYYQVVPKGGIDGGSYLQCYGSSTSKTDAQSIVRYITLEKNACYYMEGAGCNTSPSAQRFLTGISTTGINKRVEFSEVSTWAKQGSACAITADNILGIQLTGLAGKAMIDNLMVAKLFDTKEEALADAKECEQKRFEAFKTYNTFMPQLNTILQSYMNETGVTAREMEDAIQSALKCIQQRHVVDSLASDVQLIKDYNLTGVTEISKKYDALRNFTHTSIAAYLDDLAELKALVKAALPYTANKTLISNPDFSSTIGWNVKSGTYTSGDQTTTTQAGKKCWNAWWSISASGNEAQTMAVNQSLTKLPGGLYALECMATTQHLCETDQHSFLTVGETTVNSMPLPYGLLDLPAFSNSEKWVTLTTPYIYVEPNGTATIGFQGSKQGAVDKQWMPYASPTSAGDNREGWWCATDFTLRYVPMQLSTADAAGWGTVCTPYVITAPEGVTLYSIVGLSPDSLYIGIEEVTGETVAGTPYIYKAQPSQQVLFAESGTAVTAAKTNVNGLRGTFSTAAKYPLNALALTDGKWKVVTERYPIISYSAYIYKVAQLPVLPDGWTGITLMTEGLAKGTSVGQVQADDAATTVRYYNLAGQTVSPSAKGIIVTEKGKGIRK